MNADDNARTPRAAQWEAAAVALLLLYFAGRIVFFALTIAPDIPPDETSHMGRVAIFATTWGLPEDHAALAANTFVPSEPFLYYWLAARLVSLNAGSKSDLVFLRLFSGMLGLITVLYGWRWMRLFAIHPLSRILFVVMMTNTLMFTLVCASVSYDPLVNLCAAAAIYHLTRYLTQPNGPHVLAALFFLAVGGLTKFTILPLAAAVVVCILIRGRRELFHPRSWLATKRPTGQWLLVVAVVLLVGLNVALYGSNLLRYGKPVPDPDQVYSEELILASPVWARNIIAERYRDGEISYPEAVALARKIPHQAAARDTMGLLRAAERERREGVVFRPMPVVLYALTWAQMIGERTFGILAHQNALKEGVQLLPYLAIGLVALYQFFVQWRPLRQERCENYIAFVVLAYILVVMLFVNYRAYLSTEQIVMTVQGRYLFPVIVPFYGLVARYYLDHWPAPVRWILFVIAALIFLGGDLPSLLLSADWADFVHP